MAKFKIGDKVLHEKEEKRVINYLRNRKRYLLSDGRLVQTKSLKLKSK